MKAPLISALLIAVTCALTGCTEKNTNADADLLARVGKHRLVKSDLDKILTPELTHEDSVRLTRTYVKSWVESRVIAEIAARNIPDMSQIDRMVQEYRDQLIAWEYRRLMFIQHSQEIYPDDSIAAYYEHHKSEFVLERPLIKGVYVKIDSKSPSLQRVKKLYKSTRDADIDRLEKHDLKGLIHYDYFRDHWVDWEQIETRIPMDFGSSPDLFLASHKSVETAANGYTHLLEISDYLPTGSIMPLEWAKERIVNDLFNINKQEYDSRLRMDLLNQGLNDGTIVINIPLQD